jgi:hypothetical protein
MRTDSPGWFKYYKKAASHSREKQISFPRKYQAVGGWRNINKNPQTQAQHKAFILLNNIVCFLII